MVKKWLCLALASVMMLSTLAGCGGRVIITDSTKVGLQPALTKQEVLDDTQSELDKCLEKYQR